MMLTINDIRNPKRKSGFTHVHSHESANSDRGRTPTWRAEINIGGGNRKDRPSWRGPSRKNPIEAAQDYCDYVNGLDIPVSSPLNTAGHGSLRDSVERDAEVEAALGVLRDAKAQRAGRQGYVYLIGVKGDGFGVKIGYSVKPEARVGELQTGNPRVLQLLASMPGTLEDERRIHSDFIDDNLVGEWFQPSEALLGEFGLDFDAWVHSIYGSVTEPEGTLVTV